MNSRDLDTRLDRLFHETLQRERGVVPPGQMWERIEQIVVLGDAGHLRRESLCTDRRARRTGWRVLTWFKVTMSMREYETTYLSPVEFWRALQPDFGFFPISVSVDGALGRPALGP